MVDLFRSKEADTAAPSDNKEEEGSDGDEGAGEDAKPKAVGDANGSNNNDKEGPSAIEEVD